MERLLLMVIGCTFFTAFDCLRSKPLVDYGSDVTFINLDNLDNSDCFQYCLLANKDNRYFIQLFNQTYCFCSQLAPATESINGVTQAVECSLLSTECVLEDYLFDNITTGLELVSFDLNPASFTTNTSGTISFTGASVNNTDYQIVYTFDNGDVDFPVGGSTVHTFYTPGYHQYTAELDTIPSLQDPSLLTSSLLTSNHFIKVDSLLEDFYFQAPLVFETGTSSTIYLRGRSATAESLQVTSVYSNDDGKVLSNKNENIRADVYSFEYGMSMKKISITGGNANPTNGLWVIPSITFQDDGFLTNVIADVETAGAVQFVMLKPVCANEYCISTRQCCLDGDKINLVTSRMYTIDSSDSVPSSFFTVETNVLLNFPDVGHKVVAVPKAKINVNKGSILAYHQTSSSARFNLEASASTEIFVINGVDSGAVTVNSNSVGTLKFSPKLSVQTSKFYGYKMEEALTSPGTIVLTATYGGKVVTTTKPVQEKISNLSFVENLPAQLVDRHKVLMIQATQDKGSSISYNFTMTGPGDYMKNVASQSDTFVLGVPEVSLLPFGPYEVKVLASNLLNSNTTSTSFYMCAKITQQDLTVSKNEISTNENVQFTVKVHNGNNVTMEMDYGDGSTPLTRFIADSTIAAPSVFTKSYPACGKYTVSVKVKNPLSTSDWESLISPSVRSLNVDVYCPISGLTVVTSPVYSDTRRLEISAGVEVELQVSLVNGSFPQYIIDWGDGTKEPVSYNTASTFTVKHAYYKEETFQIIVNVTNQLGVHALTQPIQVVVTNCSVPDLIFNYGTEESPRQYTRGQSITLRGFWPNKDKCTKEVSKNYAYTGSTFKSTTDGILVSDELPFLFDLSNRVIEYTIPVRTYQAGSYKLVLKMTYKGELYKYNGYFQINQSPLEAVISNNNFQTLPSIRKNGSFYNVHLSADESRDPDNRQEGYASLNFTWYCRLQTENVTLVELAKLNRNDTSVQYKCLNKNWEDIAISHGVYYDSNAFFFLPTIQYEFRVLVTKGERSSTDDQTVLFAEGDPPSILLKCTANCEQKISTQGEFSYSLDCTKYLVSQQFASIWRYTENNEVIEIKSTGNCYKHNLVIAKDLLTESTNFTFEFRFRYAGGKSESIYKINKMTSERPKIGRCFVKGNNFNITVGNLIDIECENWQTSDPPLKYELRTKLDNGNDNTVPSDISQFPRQYFGQGKKANAYKLQDVRVRIINKVGQHFEDPVDIYVRPPPASNPVTAEKLLGNIDVTDTESVAAAVNVFMSANNGGDDDDGGDTEGKDTSTGGSEGDFGGIKVVTEEEEEKKAAEKKRLQEETSNLITTMTNSISNETSITGLAAAMNAVETISSNNVDDSSTSIEAGSAANIITENILAKLELQATDPSAADSGAATLEPEQVNEIMSIAVRGLSTNLLASTKGLESDEATTSSDTSTDDSSTSSSTTDTEEKEKQEEAKKKQKEVLETMRNNINKLGGTYARLQVAGGEPKVIKSPEVTMAVQKVSSPTDLSNRSISTSPNNTDASRVVMPDTASFLNASAIGEVGVMAVQLKTNVFLTFGGASDVGSELSTFTFSSGDTELSIKDTPVPIPIEIINKPQDLKSENISLGLPGHIIHHGIELKSPSCSLILKLNTSANHGMRTNLTVLIQLGKSPSSVDFDVKLYVNESHGLSMVIGDSSPVNGTNTNMFPNAANSGRSVYARLNEDGSIMLWNFPEYAYFKQARNNTNSSSAATSKPQLNFAFWYEGGMPPLRIVEDSFRYDQIEYPGSFNVSLKTFCASCSYADLQTNEWSEEGCEIVPEETELARTMCHCNHFTTFGSFFVQPNALKPITLQSLKDGYVLLVMVASMLLFYFVGLIFTRRADRHDSSKVGVCPLPDNRPEDRYLYEVTVNTGSRRRAGTSSNVYFTLSGDLGESGVRILKDPKRRTFQRSSADVFVMAASGSLGDLNFLKIWHDNKGGGWYLRSVEIIDLQTEEKYIFIAGRWLAVDQHDGLLECALPVAGAMELKDFNYIFSAKSRRDLSDAHIWFSIYARPPRSNFTRSQRLSVAMSLIFTSMVASCMFYGAIPAGNAAQENRIGNFSFTWQQVFVAIISACITVPINVILVGLFRSIRPAPVNLGEAFPPSTEEGTNYTNVGYDDNDTDSEIYEMTENRIDSASPSNEKLIKEGLTRQDSLHLTLGKKDFTDNDDETTIVKQDKKQTKKKKKKKPFYLPHCMLYFAWVLNMVVIFGCGFMVVWYGMTFGNKKSLDWLASVSICLIQDVLFIQPMKVFFVALFVALIVKKLEDEERSEIEKHVKTLAKNESWLHTNLENEKESTTIFDRVDTETAEPPNKDKMDRMRAARLKEIKMNAITREILLYLFFTVIVFLIGFMTRDYRSFHQTRDLEELMLLKTRENIQKKYLPVLPFRKTLSKSDMWRWIETFLLPEFFPEKWYNISNKFENDSNVFRFPNKLYMNDVNSKVVTGIRIRQTRVKGRSCEKAEEVAPFVNVDCMGSYSPAREVKSDFAYNWSIPKTFKHDINPNTMPWRYQTWKELDGYPIWAELDTYYGGGYVVELFPKWNNKANIRSLKENMWVDRHTRAVIVEFAIYNGNTNYFDSINIVFEFPAGGGIVHYHSVITFKMYRYTDQFAFFMIACEVLFILFMITFSIREARTLYRERWAYFKEFWNLVEFSNIVLSIMAIFFNFYRDQLVKQLLGRLPQDERSPDKYINLQFAAYWDLMFTYIVALICFFVTLKFIKLLRFNRRISMLSSTLKRAWYPLMMFGILFGLVLTSATIVASLIFGKDLYGYRSLGNSVSSIVSLLLGKFSYDQFQNTNRVLGPIFFFFFNIMVNWIIMNMFISILNDVIAEVHADVKLQNNDYEMVEYMIGSFKGWFGFAKSKQQAVLQDAWEEDHADQASEMNLQSRTSAIRMSRLSRRSRRSLRSSNRSITSIKRELKRVNKEKSYEFTPHDHSIYGNSKVFNTDMSFLMVNDELDENFIDDTLNKFVQCVNFLNSESNDVNESKKLSDVMKSDEFKGKQK